MAKEVSTNTKVKPATLAEITAEFEQGQSLHISNAEELLKHGAGLGLPRLPGGDLQPYVLVPDGYKAEPIPRATEKPLLEYIRQGVFVGDDASFAAYVKEFQTPSTVIFMTAMELAAVTGGGSRPEFIALLDYHVGGEKTADRFAARVAHRVTYPVPLSTEFKTWLALNKVAQSQTKFIDFIEDNAVDVLKPDSATLMEMIANFESRSEVTFASKVDRFTGGKVLNFSEQVDATTTSRAATGTVKVPDMLELELPVFEGGDLYKIFARLSYKPQSGKLTIEYTLQQPSRLYRTALQELRTKLMTALGLPILNGGLAGGSAETERF